jgi:hypothetical protein
MFEGSSGFAGRESLASSPGGVLLNEMQRRKEIGCKGCSLEQGGRGWG